jgi:hypothetical protein
VVADFKTEALAARAELATHAERYRSQGEVYCRALQASLGLPRKPRFELWFLRHDHIQILP